MEMIMSDHAIQRQQQRCISALEVELLLMYGRAKHKGDGSVVTYLDKRGYKRLERDVRRVVQRVERLKTEYIVEIPGSRVVTVGHRYRPIKKK